MKEDGIYTFWFYVLLKHTLNIDEFCRKEKLGIYKKPMIENEMIFDDELNSNTFNNINLMKYNL